MFSLSNFSHFILIIALSHSSEFFIPDPYSDADVYSDNKKIKAYKYVRLVNMTGLIYYDIFIYILIHIFSLSLTQQHFSAAWEEAALVPIFKMRNHAPVSIFRIIFLLSNFSELLESIIHDNVLHYAKFNPDQHGFTRTEPTISLS
jgi:hypothetical protein